MSFCGCGPTVQCSIFSIAGYEPFCCSVFLLIPLTWFICINVASASVKDMYISCVHAANARTVMEPIIFLVSSCWRLSSSLYWYNDYANFSWFNLWIAKYILYFLWCHILSGFVDRLTTDCTVTRHVFCISTVNVFLFHYSSFIPL